MAMVEPAEMFGQQQRHDPIYVLEEDEDEEKQQTTENGYDAKADCQQNYTDHVHGNQQELVKRTFSSNVTDIDAGGGSGSNEKLATEQSQVTNNIRHDDYMRPKTAKKESTIQSDFGDSDVLQRIPPEFLLNEGKDHKGTLPRLKDLSASIDNNENKMNILINQINIRPDENFLNKIIDRSSSY